MELILPHVSINLEHDNCVSISTESYAVFNYIDDYLALDCNVDWDDRFTSENDEGYPVYTMYFSEKYSYSMLETLLQKLSEEKLQTLFEQDGFF